MEGSNEYEFDAAQFYDFSRPEHESEIEEAERWFEVSGNYPHSPFIVKLNLEKILYPEVSNSSAKKERKYTKSTTACLDTDIRQCRFSNSKEIVQEQGRPILQNTAKAQTKAADKLSQPKTILTFMEPTASYLAKLHNSQIICTRFERTSRKPDQRSRYPRFDYLATKRQKLQFGHLNKVTVPKEAELRAQRRTNNSLASNQTEKQKVANFKAAPLNKKILEAHPLPEPVKSKPRSPEFQGGHYKTIGKANRHSSAKENGLSADESQLIQQFSKLSVGSVAEIIESTSQLKRHPLAKGLTNVKHDSSQSQFTRCFSKPNQCGGHMRVHDARMSRLEAEPHPYNYAEASPGSSLTVGAKK